jgi:hypothetical protein
MFFLILYVLATHYAVKKLTIRPRPNVTIRLLLLYILQQLLYLSVIRDADVRERTLRAFHEETTQCPNRHPQARVGERGAQDGV